MRTGNQNGKEMVAALVIGVAPCRKALCTSGHPLRISLVLTSATLPIVDEKQFKMATTLTSLVVSVAVTRAAEASAPRRG